MITGKNESKILTKDLSCECKYEFDGRKCNSNQKWNNYKCQCKCKKHHICEKDYMLNPSICRCENGKLLLSITDNSVITCDKVNEVIDAGAKSNDEETKAVPTNFNEKSETCKTQNFYILLAFSLITIVLLIAVVSRYCYLIRYRAKQKHFLPFHVTSNDLREVLYK